MLASDALIQMAQRFETYASDQRASLRWLDTIKEKHKARERAGVWDGAAKELREAAEQVKKGATGDDVCGD